MDKLPKNGAKSLRFWHFILMLMVQNCNGRQTPKSFQKVRPQVNKM